MTPFLKLIKGPYIATSYIAASIYSLLSFFYFIANSVSKTFLEIPHTHKLILVSLYYIIFISCVTRIFYGSPLKLIQTYISEKFEDGQVSMISLILTFIIPVLLFICANAIDLC